MPATKIIELLGMVSDSEAIEEAAAALRDGKTVVFPTETVYGLGCCASNPEAVRRVYEIKGRAWGKPLASYIASPGEAARYGVVISAEARRLAERFWPGPLTLLLPGAGGQRIGFRCPDDPHAFAVIRRAGVPVAGTSANRSGEKSPMSGVDAARLMDGLADIVLKGGRTRCGRESTIVDLAGADPRMVREGVIGREEIEEALGRPVR
ncbi:MAG: L-threonylcarbamoyladenylate synthase [Chlamydiota bacterium]